MDRIHESLTSSQTESHTHMDRQTGRVVCLHFSQRHCVIMWKESTFTTFIPSSTAGRPTERLTQTGKPTDIYRHAGKTVGQTTIL